MTFQTITQRPSPRGIAPLSSPAGILFLLFASVQFLVAQTNDHWPMPSVVLYDCDYSAVVTDTTSQKILGSSSRWILQNILSDTSSSRVFLFSYGYADTTATDLISSGYSFTLPDSGAPADANYVIASNIVGSTGSYTLTVSLQDGHTYAHVVDGTAVFGSITDDDVESACLSAVQQLLPLTTHIRIYQQSMKQANPSLVINPQVDLAPAELELPLNGSTNVAITVIDCDGAPIANRPLTLEATYGSFDVATVQTDNFGEATAVFTAGNSSGIAKLNAAIPDAISVTADSLNPSGSEAIVVGDVETARLWVMDFEFGRFGTGSLDQLTPVPGGTAWEQSVGSWNQSARGKFFCVDRSKRHNEMSFRDTSLCVSGRSFTHDFSKYSGPPPDGSNCPKKYWSMNGKTWNYVAKSSSENEAEASFEYDPINNYESFNVRIPY